MRKLYLALIIILFSSSTPEIKAQLDDESCFCVHHDDNPYEYFPCVIAEGTKLDTCGAAGELLPYGYYTCIDQLIYFTSRTKLSDSAFTKRMFYKKYRLNFIYKDTLADDIVLGKININQIPKPLLDVKNWIGQLNDSLSNYTVFLLDASYNSSLSFYNFQIDFNDFVTLFDIQNNMHVNFIETNHSAYNMGVAGYVGMSCIADVLDRNAHDHDIIYQNGIIKIKGSFGTSFTPNEMRLFDYTTGLITIPQEKISQSNDEFSFNTDFLHTGLYLLFYQNNLFKFIKE